MKIKSETPPPELSGYSIDRALQSRYRRGACLGCLAVPVFFLIALYYLTVKAQALPAVLYGIVGAVFLGMFIYTIFTVCQTVQSSIFHGESSV